LITGLLTTTPSENSLAKNLWLCWGRTKHPGAAAVSWGVFVFRRFRPDR
jgi:hypothetical protein